MTSILEQLKTITDVNEVLKIEEREFKAVMGVSPRAFLHLLPIFESSNAELKQRAEETRTRPRQRQVGGGRKATLKSVASKLGFILHYFKRYDTLDDLADRVGCHRSTVSRNLQSLLAVLLHTLEQINVLPKRQFTSPEELQAAFAGVEAIVVDATERPCLRPEDAMRQKAAYSGKKKQHTMKNTVIVNLRKHILFLGYTVLGSRHDYGLFKTEFPPEQDWFSTFKVWVDLGYLGFADDYQTLELHIPNKKPRKSQANPEPALSDQQKAENRVVSHVRIIVEHVIASMKHWTILTAKFRNRLADLEDQVILAAAGLHNFLLKS